MLTRSGNNYNKESTIRGLFIVGDAIVKEFFDDYSQPGDAIQQIDNRFWRIVIRGGLHFRLWLADHWEANCIYSGYDDSSRLVRGLRCGDSSVYDADYSKGWFEGYRRFIAQSK